MNHASIRFLATLPVLALFSSTVSAQTTDCVNLRPDGFVSTGFGTGASAMSGDGLFVAFVAQASDLLPGAPNVASLFVRDRATGTLQRASADFSGVPAILAASHLRISDDGRYVAFTSTAANLVVGDANGVADGFVHDMQTGTTRRVTAYGPNGDIEIPVASTLTSMSPDGLYFAFHTTHALSPADVNGRSDVYVRRWPGPIVFGSLGQNGQQSAGDCANGSISADGRRIAFTCTADDLVPGSGDANGLMDVYVYDRSLPATALVSRSTAGVVGNAASFAPVISGNGNTVVYVSSATNLDPAVTSGVQHGYAFDLTTVPGPTTSVFDVSSAGVPGNGAVASSVTQPAIDVSHDGRHVVFASISPNLVPGDTNGDTDIFARDRRTGTTQRVGVGACGQQQDDGGSVFPSISDDGLRVAFASSAENMIAGDGFGRNDYFVRDATKPPTGTLYCFGTAAAARCPCFFGRDNRGCPHSEDPAGGGFVASGVPSLSNDTLRLGGYELPTTNTSPSVCMFLQGTTNVAGGLGVILGDGLSCVGGTVTRLATKPLDPDEEAHFPGLGDPRVSVVSGVTTAGTTRYYQLWYRDSASFCSTSAFNLTNAIRVVWAP